MAGFPLPSPFLVSCRGPGELRMSRDERRGTEKHRGDKKAKQEESAAAALIGLRRP
jgi:hypothetical protein